MTEIAGQLALVVAAQFAGTAVYVSAVEHPARLRLDDRAALTEWQPSYRRGALIQAPLALIGALLGFWAWQRSDEIGWLIGGLILIAAWPYTLIVIHPTNKQLQQVTPAEAGPETRHLMERWGRLHAVRTGIGIVSTFIFLWTSIAAA